ncbi:cation:proton antiporter domain-containing protein [Ruania halotolerans]|uniref:cation:proton antiporter domain-containing protein n=1 Tax=Ruania halotolerans TaxID=2897773 RepID=UPI001E34D07B|nr:cation:proton antiporter [Ruania halotolerans]UFU06561.1 cation:proton antiporter [Ruania halotolerans]
MEELHLTYGLMGVLAAILALVSYGMRQVPLSEPLVALALGVVLGPQVLGLVEITDQVRDVVLLEGSRLIVALSVMAAALRFRASELGRVVRPVLLLLAIVMPLAAVISGAASLVMGVPLALAALIGACLCPTDPVLASSVVSGEPAERHLPGRLRHTLSVESGINDGLALPLVGLALVAVLPAQTLGAAAGLLTYQVLVGVVIGIATGALAGWGVRRATRNRELERAPDLILPLLLAVGVLGVAKVAQTDGILAVFVAGTVYNRMTTRDQREPQQAIDEAVNRYLALPLFLVLGVVLPWAQWVELGPAAVVFVLLVLLLRRVPLVLTLARPMRLPKQQAVFLGWFGPMGVSSLFYLAHSLEQGVTDPRLFAVGSLMVAASVLVYGLTSTPGRKLYARSAGEAAS